MKTGLNLEPVKNWLGFTRRERRSTSILLSFIFIIIALRYVLPEQNVYIQEWGGMPSDTDSIDDNSDNQGSFRKTGFMPDSTSTPSEPAGSSGSGSPAANTHGYSYKPRESLSGPAGQAKPKTKVDLNRCDTSALVALPGIGPVLSSRILKYRGLLGGFARVEQLKEVYGLSEETYELIHEKCFADTAALRRVRVNSSVYKELCRIPYIEKYEAAAILKYRELKGRIDSMADLTENKILTTEKADKSGPYMDFR